MIKKKLNNFTISFIPGFQLNNLSSCRDLFDFTLENNLNYELENEGEKFLGCANISPYVKVVAGFFRKFLLDGNKFKTNSNFFYSSRFCSRDILACIEIIKREIHNDCLKEIPYNLKTGHAGSGCYIPNHVCDILSPKNCNDIFLNLFKNTISKVIDNYQTSDHSNSKKVNIILIGSNLPPFNDLFQTLKKLGALISHVEYFHIFNESLCEKFFFADLFFNLRLRLANVITQAGFTAKNNPDIKTGIIHCFPKFSHHEIEDHFFTRNINIPYLSLEYGGGSKLGERELIRLESFVKIIG